MNPGRNRTWIWMAAALAATFAWVALCATLTISGGDPEPAPPNLEGSGPRAPADFNWTLLDLDEAPVEFAKFRGRPILLNLWATWCGPCLEEMPALARLADNPRIKEKNVAVVCVSTDESAEVLRRFVQGKPWGMTILRATSIPPGFQTSGIPATFLIDPEGRVVTAQVGAARWDDPSVIAFLEKLAAPPP